MTDAFDDSDPGLDPSRPDLSRAAVAAWIASGACAVWGWWSFAGVDRCLSSGGGVACLPPVAAYPLLVCGGLWFCFLTGPVAGVAGWHVRHWIKTRRGEARTDA